MSFVRQFAKWLRNRAIPELDWIQIEPSSFCTSNCTYCPHTVLSDSWRNRHMTSSTFHNLLPSLRSADLVYLQGWGEPLLNPNFFEMVRMAKESGARVGMTTNGMLLDEQQVSLIVANDIDIIGLSLAGTGGTNDGLRGDANLDHVMNAIRCIDSEKRRRGSEYPAVHIAYLLLRPAVDDLRRLPALLDNTGIDTVVVSTLDFVVSPELADQTVTPTSIREYDEWRSLLQEVKAAAEHRGFTLHFYLRHPDQRRQVCTENADRALYVSADGAVSPCVFLNLPVEYSERPKQAAWGPPATLTFGNVNDQTLAEIWRCQDYTAFRRSFLLGEPPTPCRSCPKLYLTVD
jgi:MoaA/NifB/PqqE/SkfB family radical SAM enzyme